MKYKDYSKNDLDISVLRDYLKDKITTSEDNSVKNYKLMCEFLKEEEGTGNSRKAQINRWKRYFEFHKEGQKFVIDEIYDEPQITLDQRKYRHFVGEEKFLVPIENRNSKGVYIIQAHNNVYIRSTYAKGGFVSRFIQHHNKQDIRMHHTKELLDEPNATFSILYLAKDTDTEEMIRHKEADYIQKYIKAGYNVINKKTETTTYYIPNTYERRKGKQKLYFKKDNNVKRYVSKNINIEYDLRFSKDDINKINETYKLGYEIVYISMSSVFMKNNKKIIA